MHTSSEGDMHIIEKALDWLENSSYVFNETSKIGSIKNLRRDFLRLKKNLILEGNHFLILI